MRTQRVIALIISFLVLVCFVSSIVIWKNENQAKPLPPTNGVTFSYHDDGYEKSWIQDIDKEKGLVLVTTKDSKMSIIFKPSVGNLEKFNISWIAPVTFQCTKLKNGKCDFNLPYELFVSNGLVEVIKLLFSI